MRKVVIMFAIVALFLGAAVAQESRSEISLQGTGFFTKDSSGQGTTQRATNTGGFLVGYRYNLTRWLAAEADYGYDHPDFQGSRPMFTRPLEASWSAFRQCIG